ncbi:MAG: hypothetical protein EOO36_02975 [Cytophagaceae bacterium]|nr:MAG: hypothetical protein EOO36_02975 [Cytophagaceae bacterium]
MTRLIFSNPLSPLSFMEQRYTQATDFWQERDFGQKISATFEFIGAHWRPLGRVMLYLVVPAALVQAILVAVLQSRFFLPLQQDIYSQSRVGRFGGAYSATFSSPIYWLSNIASTTFHSILILSIYGYLFLCVYPPAHGGLIQPSDVWQVVQRKFWGTFFSLYGVVLLVLFGFVLLHGPHQGQVVVHVWAVVHHGWAYLLGFSGNWHLHGAWRGRPAGSGLAKSPLRLPRLGHCHFGPLDAFYAVGLPPHSARPGLSVF